MSRAKDRELVRRARADHGLVGEAAAREVLQRDDALQQLVAGGLWQEVLPGVLAPAAVVVDTAIRENAVHLWEKPVLLSHYSAARKEGFWVPDDPDAWALVPFKSTKRDLPGLQVRRTRHWPVRCRQLGEVKWTKAERTLVDLSALLSPRQLEASLMSAVRHEKTTAAKVAETAAGMRRREGVATLLGITGLWDPKRESLLEDKLHLQVCSVVPYGVERQVVVEGPDGRTARVDVGIPHLRLAFEADGLFFHSSESQIASDQDRDRWMAGVGWPTHRFREGALDEPALVRQHVRAIVEQRSRDLGIPFAA